MKKILKTIVVTLIISIMSSIVVFADGISSAEEIRIRLLELGVPNTYVGNIIEYLQKTEVSEETYKIIKAKIDEAERVLNGDVDISLIDDERKQILQNLATESAAAMGLRVVFGKDSKGVTTVTIIDANNNHIASLDTMHVIEIIRNLDLEKIHETTKEIIKFAIESKKDEFEPIGGDFNNTGTNIGNKIALGLGLIALSGITFIRAKKVFI